MLDSKSPSASPLAQPPTASPSKRKRDEAPDKSSTNPIKRKKPNKAGKDDDADLDLDAGVNDAFGRMDGRLLADFVAQCTKRFEGDLSVVELEDKHIPGELSCPAPQHHRNRLIMSLLNQRKHSETPRRGKSKETYRICPRS